MGWRWGCMLCCCQKKVMFSAARLPHVRVGFAFHESGGARVARSSSVCG